MALFDENTPQLNYFQKPIFGKKTLLRNPNGTRTGLSTALTAGLSWMGGLSPLGSEAYRGLDNLIQGGERPKYLTDQDWYAENVRSSEANANAVGTVVGGVADSVRGLAEQAAGALTGTGAAANIATGITTPDTTPKPDFKPTVINPTGVVTPTDPNTTFQQMLKRRPNTVMTPEQRRQNQIEAQRQMGQLPAFDANPDPNDYRFYSDTPLGGGVPNFLKGIRAFR